MTAAAASDRKRWGVVVFGLLGVALLLGLGVWQTQRAEWKRGVIADLEARLAAPPRAVDGSETPGPDDYARAVAVGRYVSAGPQARYLTSLRPHGPGFRLIAAFELESGIRILVDRGFAPESAAAGLAEPPLGRLRLSGVLRWPSETNAFTPEPNRERLMFFARDVPALAEALGAAPVMLVVEAADPLEAAAPAAEQGRWPQPGREKVSVPNSHVGYAVTWFSLAAIWLALTIYAGRRRRAGARGA